MCTEPNDNSPFVDGPECQSASVNDPTDSSSEARRPEVHHQGTHYQGTQCAQLNIPEFRSGAWRVTAYRADGVSLSLIAIVVACGIRRWWGFLSAPFDGYPGGGISDDVLLFWFFLWCLPSGFRAAMLIFTFGWRSAISKVVLSLAVGLLLTALVVVGIGAR